MKYEFLDHTADIKFKTYGRTLNEAFENVILAFSEIVSRGEKISSKKGKVINISGNDKENLLYNFIEELIYLLDAEHFIVAKGEITLRGNNLKADLYGDDTKNYESLEHVKAATYSEMKVIKVDDNFEIQAVVDV